MLADFTTVSDALTCAVEVQREFKTRNEALPEAKFELVVNLKSAKTLGIKLPELVLLRADEVIK